MTQGTTQLFSSGFETASFVASSGLLSAPWNLIADLNAETHPNENLFWKKRSNESDSTIIAFGTAQNRVGPDLLCSSDMMDNPFEFLCSKKNPYFSLNQPAMSLFNDHRPSLGQLKSEIDLEKPVIVTGLGVGGSVASLFTLWLIEKMGLSDKRPLCITFGSPLIGDKHLQEAISRSSSWNSCFLHVASHRDPLDSSFISNDSYRPFGTFLLCSDCGSTCSENPDSISRLLKEMSTQNQGPQIPGYGNIVERLSSKAICKDSDVPNMAQNLLQASLASQLQALGFSNSHLSQNDLVKDLERHELLLTLNKRKRFIPDKRLDEMKTYMAQLEWYKKISKNRRTGYYDSYKNDWFPRDQDVLMFVKILNNYWKDMVEEVEKKPQKEVGVFRTRWLYAGTNYRRMVEPLDIAKYYKEGGEDYINKGRSEHYKQLQKWKEEDKKAESINRKNVQSILTMDSCFWAHVEEALISLRKCKAAGSSVAEKQEAMKRLEEFEEYVYGLLKNYTVSPEIFLEDSSYMRWWKDYKTFKGASYDSRLANFMKKHAAYEKGEYDFSLE
ncbi:senescence-associated carboxylesterase 101-like [Neltuma alba]|uniref:senescence-associated carboxylesterase 101-like n=1 Tax=Neltuma alba TaxID=207710 RepID=UPI0010A30608|nr:senescence-associated carboxylesterase 101-like [Prosopis alba]XP_028778653.1 senescence-associated carboxylesterase 101-like [Prosopis alba]